MPKSKKSVYSAFIANVFIAVTKLVAGFLTTSSAMISEGIHSIVDSINQILLLIGINRSKLPADEMHPFGHGSEVYFWSLIVAVMIFGLGGGVSIYEGINSIQNPEEIVNPIINYVVLVISFILEGSSLVISLRNLGKNKKETFWSAFKKSKDPATISVIAEDGAAVIGLGIATMGVFLSVVLHEPFFDGLASVFIGVVLIAVASVLASEIRGLLVGERAYAEIIDGIKQLAKALPFVIKIDKPLTLQLSPDEVLLTLHVTFEADLQASKIAQAVDELEQKIKQKYPTIKYIYIETEAISQNPRENQNDMEFY